MLDQRKKVALAVVGSIGLHFIVLFLWALTVQWLPGAETTAQATPAPTATPEPIKLTVEREPEKPDLLPIPEAVPEPTPSPTPTPSVRFLDTHDLAETATPPPDAAFQSARNTAAASELPPEGDAPLPTQRGREVPSFAVQTQQYVASEAEEPPTPANTPTPPVETSPPLPRAVAKPPTTAPAKPADVALAEPPSIPTEPTVAEPNPYDPSFRAPASLTEPPRPTPVRTARSGYQPQQYKTAMSGSVSNKGGSSVASSASPIGIYQDAVIKTIGRRWNAYIGGRADLAATGSVTIHFLVGMDGRPRSTRIVSNTANEALSSLSLQAIMDSRMPPMPAEAVPETSGGQLPVDITFEFLDSPNY